MIATLTYCGPKPINFCRAEFIPENTKIVFATSIISQHFDNVCSWNLSSLKTGTRVSYNGYITRADGLVMQVTTMGSNTMCTIWCVNASGTSSREITWWRHPVETFSALRTLCAGNSPVTVEFPSQRQVKRSFDRFFDLRLNNGWVNNREAGDWRRHRTRYDLRLHSKIITEITHWFTMLSNQQPWCWLRKVNMAFSVHLVNT